MWILFRIAVALAAFLARFIWPFFRPRPAGRFAGQTWFKKVERSRGGSIYSFRIGMPIRAPVVFRLQAEESSDRWFKRMGLAHEFQTGDVHFDEAVYIASDHPAVHRLLKEKPEARNEVEAVLDAGFRRIFSDGRILWIERHSEEEPGDADLKQLDDLRVVLSQMRPALALFSDPFNLRVIVVEALTWSIFGYAAGAVIEYMFDRADVHLEPLRLLTPGLVLGAVLFVSLVLVVRWFLGNSSRGGRIIIEGVVLLALSMPVAGVQLVADLNRALDRGPGVVTQWLIRDKHEVRRRRQATFFYIVLGAGSGSNGTDVPSQIAVHQSTYSLAARGGKLVVEIFPGAFGYRWFKRVEVQS